jgi:hypothetical protein
MFGIGPQTRLSRRLQTLDAYYIVALVLLSMGASILLGLLRSTFTGVPLLPFLATLFLLMVPEIVLMRWLFEEYLEQPFDA